MSRKRVIYVVDPTHDVEHDVLAEAIGYLGGVLVEDHNPQRPSEVILQWSPLAAKRMRPQQARTVYSGWRAIPIYVVDQIMATYAERLELGLAERKASEPKCRPCAAQGINVLATHDLRDANGDMLAERSLCWFCHDRLRRVKIAPLPLPMRDRICVRCAAQLYLTPNVREQLDLVGRFTGLCPKCWTSKKSIDYIH